MSQKLPAWKIAKKSISLIFRDFSIALRAMWLAVLVAVLLDYFHEDSANWFFGTGWIEEKKISDGVVLLAELLIAMTASSFASVFWHRNILLKEKNIPLIPLRFDACSLRYLAVNILLIFAPLVLIIMSVLVAVFILPFKALALIGVVLATPTLFYFIYRLSIILLPAVATEDKENSTLERAWQFTDGQTGPIIGLLLLSVVIFIVIGAPGAGIAAIYGSDAKVMDNITMVNSAFVNFFVTLFSVGLTSISYAFLTHKQNPQEDAPSEGP